MLENNKIGDGGRVVQFVGAKSTKFLIFFVRVSPTKVILLCY